jgi:hypothetical protein
MGTAAGAHGIEMDSDKAIFPAVDLEVHIGNDGGLKFRYPWIISGIGSTNIAKNNWEGLAIGSAMSGTGLTIGENVVGMDPGAVFKDGRIVDTVDLKRRVKLYKDYSAWRLWRDNRSGKRRRRPFEGAGNCHRKARR